MTTFRSLLDAALDRLLGPRCVRCYLHVFPADQTEHDEMWCD